VSTHEEQDRVVTDKLIDRFERVLNYLRVSITDKCNLRCQYCVSNGPFPKLRHQDILRYEEILRIVTVGTRLGISKIRVTGGEPLVRKDVRDFLARLTAIEGLDDVSLTTNGMLLSHYLQDIQSAGIKRLNISLDSLKRDRFEKITGVDGFDRVWRAVLETYEMGFAPIKINVVAIPGVNSDELMDFARLTFSYPFHIRFIEYMPIGTSVLSPGRILTHEIKEIIRPLGPLIPVHRDEFDGPSRRFRIEGAMGELGFISPVSDHFCMSCNRIRLTANGKLRLCLLSDESLDMGTVLRKGGTDDDIANIFRQAALRKHEKHRLKSDGASQQAIHDIMSSIGG
jgi:GTP 3',8-cyclase